MFTYDAEDRIVSTSGGGGSATYAHRPTGHRVLKTSGSNTTVYVYSRNRLIAEYVNGALSEEYIYLGHRMIAEYASGTLYYHHGDHLSDRMITSASGSKVGEQAHYPFGETWYSNNNTTKFHLTSYERDAESGNDYARHRFHVNRLGRFSSADPIAGCSSNPQGLNRFSYVGNDPINRTDPMGLSFCWDFPDLCGWDDPNFGAPPDDEGDTGLKDSGGGCDPSIDALDPACGPPPPPPIDECAARLGNLYWPSTVICDGKTTNLFSGQLLNVLGNPPLATQVTLMPGYGGGAQFVPPSVTLPDLIFELSFKVSRYHNQPWIQLQVKYTCNGNVYRTGTPRLPVSCSKGI